MASPSNAPPLFVQVVPYSPTPLDISLAIAIDETYRRHGARGKYSQPKKQSKSTNRLHLLRAEHQRKSGPPSKHRSSGRYAKGARKKAKRRRLTFKQKWKSDYILNKEAAMRTELRQRALIRQQVPYRVTTKSPRRNAESAADEASEGSKVWGDVSMTLIGICRK